MLSDLLNEIATMQRRVARAAADGTPAPSASRGVSADTVAGMIDHTLLRPDATEPDIRALCAEARRGGFAAVCVNPVWVALCADELRDVPVGICAVVDFPLGAGSSLMKAAGARSVIDLGAEEVDMVVDIGALRGGDPVRVHAGIAGVAAECRASGVLLKVIIETALLTRDEKVAACVIARDAGADFVKTSTGFAGGGAAASDVALMRFVVGPEVGVKASGGIRGADDALAMIAAGANRIGTSSGRRIVDELRDMETAETAD